jgi:hypothetical protein
MPKTRANRRALPLLFSVLAAACGSSEEPAPSIPLPEGARAGDEIVASIEISGDVPGSFADADAPGLLLELTLGANLPRHAVFPGGLLSDKNPRLRVSLGAWDGGPLRSKTLAGAGDASITVEIDLTAAGVPIMGLYDGRFFNDVPLGVYVEDGTFTYILSNEDAGTGLFPTLLMARYGRPNDIEGLYEFEPEPKIQAEGHEWIPFNGPFEGSHPRLRIATLNGLVAPDDADPPATYRVSPMPLAFKTEGVLPRERVLDQEPWMLAASFDEMKRQDQFAEDGGRDDAHIGALDDYIFIDYQFDSSSGAALAFEAQVDTTWLSSLGFWTGQGGPADARAIGVGRTCIELPPGRGPADITALRAVASGSGSGALVAARWFRYDPGALPVDIGSLAAPVDISAGTDLLLSGQAP